MESKDNNRLAAVEAILAETAKQIKHSQAVAEMDMQKIRETQAETDRLIRHSQAVAEMEMQKIRESQAETDRLIRQSQATFEQEMRLSREEFDRKSDALNKQIGGISNSNGLFAEEYFFNSFENGKQTFFGETFDAIKKNLKGTETDDEFDVVMLNGHAVGIVEVKYKARENDIPKVLQKVNNFRLNFPKYNNHRVYLGYATLAFDKNIEQECINQGIAIIKQIGDTVVINDEHLKVF